MSNGRPRDGDVPPCAEPAPLLGAPAAAAPGYIVVFREGTDAAATAAALAREHGFTPDHVYASALRGFSARLSSGALAAVRCHPAVEYVEHDASVRLF